jgi:hypothetical protein
MNARFPVLHSARLKHVKFCSAPFLVSLRPSANNDHTACLSRLADAAIVHLKSPVTVSERSPWVCHWLETTKKSVPCAYRPWVPKVKQGSDELQREGWLQTGSHSHTARLRHYSILKTVQPEGPLGMASLCLHLPPPFSNSISLDSIYQNSSRKKTGGAICGWERYNMHNDSVIVTTAPSSYTGAKTFSRGSVHIWSLLVTN